MIVVKIPDLGYKLLTFWLTCLYFYPLLLVETLFLIKYENTFLASHRMSSSSHFFVFLPREEINRMLEGRMGTKGVSHTSVHQNHIWPSPTERSKVKKLPCRIRNGKKLPRSFPILPKVYNFTFLNFRGSF